MTGNTLTAVTKTIYSMTDRDEIKHFPFVQRPTISNNWITSYQQSGSMPQSTTKLPPPSAYSRQHTDDAPARRPVAVGQALDGTRQRWWLYGTVAGEEVDALHVASVSGGASFLTCQGKLNHSWQAKFPYLAGEVCVPGGGRQGKSPYLAR